MKKIFYLILLLALPSLLHAQKEGQELIDSILKQLSVAKEDINRVKLENRITYAYAMVDPKEGINHATRALELARKLKYEQGIEDAAGALAIVYSQSSDYPKGLEYFFLALKMAEEKGDKKDIQTRLYNVSSIYFNMGNFNKALEYANKSLALCQELKDTPSIGSNLSNIGAIYGEQKDQQKALEYLFKALKTMDNGKDKPILGATLEHIGITYYDLKDYPHALEYSDKALKVNREIDNRDGVALDLMNLGNIYLDMAKDTTTHDGAHYAQGYNTKYYQKAIECLNQSLDINKDEGDQMVLKDINRNLSNAYELSGNYKEALKTYKTFIDMRDSIFSNDNKIKLAKLETQREAELKDKQIKINKLEKSLFIGGTCLLLIVIIVVARNFIIQKRANKVKGELLRQKDVLMKEIHHRVKNNLQVISTLLDLQLTNITDEHAKSAMTESNIRVRSISLIHQQLYQNENITTIEFSQFTKDLLHQITSVFTKNNQSIALRCNMPETILDIDTAVPLGLILNELMTNSYKYAFPEACDGTIEITLDRDGGNYRLTYSDSGPGLPPGLNIPGLKSLGMKVMRSLSKQIGGTFSYVEKDKNFVITFKDISARKLTD